MSFALLIIDLRYIQMLIVLSRSAESHQTAFIRRCRLAGKYFVRDEDRHLAVLGWINPIVHEWRSEWARRPAIARGRRECRPITGQHCGRYDESLIIRRVLTKRRPLVTPKEKKLILQNRPTDRSAKLVALERAPRLVTGNRVHRRKIGFGIEQVVPDKFKKVAMQLVCSRLRHHCH